MAGGRIKLVRVSDVFRKFADLLDKHHDLTALSDPQYAQLSKVVNILVVYTRDKMGGRTLMRGLDPQCDYVPLAGSGLKASKGVD